MKEIRVQQAAALHIDEIYRYTSQRWGEVQAEAYIRGLFETFEIIAAGNAVSRPVPAEFGVSGYFLRYRRHFIYWKNLSDGAVGIVAVLHERMHQMDRFREDHEQGISK